MNSNLISLIISVLSTFSVTAQTSALFDDVNSTACKHWVDSVYATMTTQERVAQLVVQNIQPTMSAANKAHVKDVVEKYHVGGLFFSKGSSAEFAEMNNYAQSLAKVPLLMCIDGEWGPSMRVTDAPVFPYNMALGAIQDPALLYRYGQETARQCRALGILTDFSPDLDVNSNPNNPVIGNRSFGEDPWRVAALGRAYALGMEAGGVMAVGKHFPGHGDTSTDSHKTLPKVNHTRQQLDDVDLIPFKEFIDAGCGGIMVGHLNVPALDASGRPTSMSNKVTTGLLRNELGFKGMIFTDGLGMKGALVDEDNSVAALKAGADVLLSPTDLPRSLAAVTKAIESGKIPMSAIEERCKRMLAYKYALGLTKPIYVDKATIKDELNAAEAEALIQELADAAITVVRNEGNLLPIGNLADTDIAVVNIGADDNEFISQCRKYADIDAYHSKDGSFSAKTLSNIKNHDVVVAAVYTDNANAVNTLAALKDVKGLVPVFMLNPYKVAKFSTSLVAPKALVLAYEDSNELRSAAAKALFGGVNVSGRVPVNIKGVAHVGDGVNIAKSRLGYSSPVAKGMNPNITERLDTAIIAAMESGAFPGAQVLVVKGGDVVFDRCYGYTTKGGDKITPNTVFDLASVSKTVGTLPGVMKAYDLGLFEMDRPAYNYVPGLDVEGKREITPRMLLYHETGMPAALNMYKTMMDTLTYTGAIVTSKRDKDHNIAINGGGFGHDKAKMRTDIVSNVKTDIFDIEAAKGIYTGKLTYDTIMAYIYRSNIKPERKFVYSCLNFCLLMDLEQHVTGLPHQLWVEDSIWAPIGAYGFCYRPTERYDLSQIAATEQDNYLRRQHVHGFVHDELAAFSGGVQGNAGVFGTATDIAKLCQMWLNGGDYGDARVLSEGTTELFTTSKSPTCRRGLGFDKPDMVNPDNSPCCDEAPASTYGHTGFTGTCFWVDPDNDLIFVFLSNRVDPTRANKAFSASAIRPRLMTMIYESLQGAE